jgi:hypothetical protein
MAIIYSKKGTSWPVLSLLELWLYNVQNDRNSVLIVISYDTLMSICSIRSHNSISLACELCWFISLYKLHNRWIELILDKVVVLYETSLITFYIMITSRTSCRCPKKDVWGKSPSIVISVIRTRLRHVVIAAVILWSHRGVTAEGMRCTIDGSGRLPHGAELRFEVQADAVWGLGSHTSSYLIHGAISTPRCHVLMRLSCLTL